MNALKIFYKTLASYQKQRAHLIMLDYALWMTILVAALSQTKAYIITGSSTERKSI